VCNNDATVSKIQEDGAVTQVYQDTEYSLSLTKDAKGTKTLVARNVKENKTVFEGPINTPEQRAKLPQPVARRLADIEKGPMIKMMSDRPKESTAAKGAKAVVEEEDDDDSRNEDND
jgi:hypothetical protein